MNLMVYPELREASRPIENNRRRNAVAMDIVPIGTIPAASDRADGPVYHFNEGYNVHSRLAANGTAQVVDVFGQGPISVDPS